MCNKMLMLSDLMMLPLMILTLGLGSACRARMHHLPMPPDAWFFERQQINKLCSAWEIRMWLVVGAGLAMIAAVKKLSDYFDHPLVDIDKIFIIHAMNEWVWLIPIAAVILFFVSLIVLMRFGAPLVGKDLIQREKDLGLDTRWSWR